MVFYGFSDIIPSRRHTKLMDVSLTLPLVKILEDCIHREDIGAHKYATFSYINRRQNGRTKYF